jgi:ferric-dicitrate binding protein FerR (iron transport regulator)
VNAQGDELIQRHLDGRATPEESAALQQALKESAEMRARFLDYVNLDVTLGAVADAAAVEGSTIVEIPVARRLPIWWRAFAAAAMCLASVVIAGLLAHHKHSSARPDLAAAIESTQKAIAQMPPPPLASLPDWISPTASLLEQPEGFQ